MAIRCSLVMAGTLIGYALCSIDEQDLTAQRTMLVTLGVDAGRIYLDHGLTGTNRALRVSVGCDGGEQVLVRSSCVEEGPDSVVGEPAEPERHQQPSA